MGGSQPLVRWRSCLVAPVEVPALTTEETHVARARCRRHRRRGNGSGGGRRLSRLTSECGGAVIARMDLPRPTARDLSEFRILTLVELAAARDTLRDLA